MSTPTNYASPPPPLASYRVGRLFTVIAAVSMIVCLAIVASWVLAEPHWHWIKFGQPYGIDAEKEEIRLWIDNFEYPWRVPYGPLAIAPGIPALIWIARRLGIQLPRKAANRARPVSRRRPR